MTNTNISNAENNGKVEEEVTLYKSDIENTLKSLNALKEIAAKPKTPELLNDIKNTFKEIDKTAREYKSPDREASSHGNISPIIHAKQKDIDSVLKTFSYVDAYIGIAHRTLSTNDETSQDFTNGIEYQINELIEQIKSSSLNPDPKEESKGR